MKVKTSAFCGLSRNKDWQLWLKDQAPDLNKELDITIKSMKGCRANSNKMMDIYYELYKRNKGQKFEDFIRGRFPWLVEEEEKNTRKEIRKKVSDLKKKGIIKKVNMMDHDAVNKHRVFTLYRPHILSFPQKLIIVGDDLFNKTQEFLKNKIGADYLIVEDRSYIEYFEQKYANVVDKIPRKNREIYKYRQKNSQNATSNTPNESELQEPEQSS